MHLWAGISCGSSYSVPGRAVPPRNPADSNVTRLFSGGLSHYGRKRVGGEIDERDQYEVRAPNNLSRQPQCCNNRRSGLRNPAVLNVKPELSGEKLPGHSKRASETASPIGNESNKLEELWRDLLADPSKWSDNRPGKSSPRYPDFKHKHTGEGLWLDSKRTPAWVPSEIAARLGSGSDEVEKLWRDFFADPSIWWDNRPGKANPNSNPPQFKHNQTRASPNSNLPDFKHKRTGKALWVNNECTPAWVKPEIASLESNYHEKKWLNLFSNPSQWWDHRSRKENSRFPDFIHKLSTEGLWLDGGHTPSWVATKVASLGQCTLQIDIISKVERLSRYNKSGYFVKTMELFEQMQQEGIDSDYYIFLHVLHACAALGVLEEGRRVHGKVIETGWELHPYISNCLVDMYARCGSLEDARIVFYKMAKRDVVGWNSLILGFAKSGRGAEALELFREMQQVGILPDTLTFLALLNACASMAALEEGRLVHDLLVRSGCESNAYVRSSLVHMYAKCGSIEDAQAVFDKMPSRDAVTWTAMIVGYVKCGHGQAALDLYQQMRRNGVEPDSTTFVALLNACASVLALEEGRCIHNLVILRGFESDIRLASSLVDMYAKCGSFEDAKTVFDKMPSHDVVAWNAMIIGFVKCGQGLAALELQQKMRQEKVEPDSTTFLALLNACASMALLDEGKRLHKQIVERGWESNEYLGNSLVDMYAKCGSIEDAKRVFDRMPTHDVVSWNTMILGFAMHGLGKEAVSLFEQMSRSGCEMNEVTFICLLSACSHGGLVDEGLQFFRRMQSVYGVAPAHEHYTCIVDILGRAGHLEEAETIIEGMPMEPSTAVWMSLLGGCRIYGNLEMGERAAQQVLKLDPENAAGM